MDHKDSFFPTEHLTEEARHAALMRIIREFNDLKSHAHDVDFHKKRQMLLALWGDLVLARHDPADNAANVTSHDADPTDHHDIIVESMSQNDQSPNAYSPAAEDATIGEPSPSIDHDEVIPMMEPTSSHSETSNDDDDMNKSVTINAHDPVHEAEKDTDQTALIISSPVTDEADQPLMVIKPIEKHDEPLTIIASLNDNDDDDRDGPLLFRLRLLKTGMLNDMVLPAGTIVTTNAADAEELISSGTAEKMLIQTEEDI